MCVAGRDTEHSGSYPDALAVYVHKALTGTLEQVNQMVEDHLRVFYKREDPGRGSLLVGSCTVGVRSAVHERSRKKGHKQGKCAS